MNRHQSNPFLAGWQQDDEEYADSEDLKNTNSKLPDTSKVSQTDGNSSNSAPQRRHSVNPLDGNKQQRGSFHSEAYCRTSMDNDTLLRMQRDDGGLEKCQREQISSQDLIAKMTADFNFAVKSTTTDSESMVKDYNNNNGDNKDFQQENLDVNLPTFDPFQTIMDDDSSLSSSPGFNSLNNNSQKKGLSNESNNNNNNNNINNNNSKNENYQQPNKQFNYGAEGERDESLRKSLIQERESDSIAHNAKEYLEEGHRHQSIDEDEDELVSTPVRNIKSSCTTAENNNLTQEKHDSEFNEKATLFASLLASAENDNPGLDTQDKLNGDDLNSNSNYIDESNNDNEVNSNYEVPYVKPYNKAFIYDDYEAGTSERTHTRVISGTNRGVGPNEPSGGDRRPISFFDPFETVIDKDALNSPMNARYIENELGEITESYADDSSKYTNQDHGMATDTANSTVEHENNNNNMRNSDVQIIFSHDDHVVNEDDEDGESVIAPVEFSATSMEEVISGAAAAPTNQNDDRDNISTTAVKDSPDDSQKQQSFLNYEVNVAQTDSENDLENESQDTDGCTPDNLDRYRTFSPSPAVSPNLNAYDLDQRSDNNDNATQQRTGLTEEASTSDHARQIESSMKINEPKTPAPTPMHVPSTKGEDGSETNETMTPASVNRTPRHRRKPSFQEDSSDEDEDDRIQIVIRAKDSGNVARSTGASFVPLLPPPPSKSSMKQARERGQVEDIPSPIITHSKKSASNSHTPELEDESDEFDRYFTSKNKGKPTESDDSKSPSHLIKNVKETRESHADGETMSDDENDESKQDDGAFVIGRPHGDSDGDSGPDTPLYDDDTSYVLEDFPPKYEGPGWEMMLRYPPKKKLTSNRFWKKIFVKLIEVSLPPPPPNKNIPSQQTSPQAQPTTSVVLQVFDKPDDKKPMQEIPLQPTYTISEISSQQFDQYGKIFTIKIQYIFYRERVGVRPGQLARFMHTGHIGSSTTSGGHGVGPTSIGDLKRYGAPIEHSPQVSQIIKLGCQSYDDVKQLKHCLEDHLFKMPIARDRALSTYKTEEIQMAVRDEIYIEFNQVGTITKQLARVRLFFLSFLNGMPVVEVGINDIYRQGKEIVGRLDILPVVTEEWIRIEASELHSTVDKDEFEKPDSRMIKLTPPDAAFFEVMRFRVRPPRNRELPLQISANMSVTRTKVIVNCDVIVPGCISRKHGQIPCEDIAIRIYIPECWIYFFRTEKHFRYGSVKSTNRRPGKVKGIERFLGGGGAQDHFNDDESLIEVTSGQAKYEHHHNAIVWRAARWPKESQSAYVQNSLKIRLPLTIYDKMPETFYEYIHVEYTMPATTVSHTTLRSISVNPCDDEPPEKYVKYSANYEYKVKMRLSINLNSNKSDNMIEEKSPIIIMKQPDAPEHLARQEDSDDDSEYSEKENDDNNNLR